MAVEHLEREPPRGGERASRSGRDAADTAPFLDRVIATLDAGAIRQIGGPETQSTPVSDVVIYDPADLDSVVRGTIVLAVGIAPDSADGVALIEEVASRGAAAIVFRIGAPLSTRAEAIADRLGVCVLGTLPEARWGYVYSLLRTAMGAGAGDPDLGTASGVALGDLFSLADAIAAAVGGPVTIEDPQWHVLAYSNLDFQIDQPRKDTILGRIPPTAWQKRVAGVAAALRSGQEVVRFDGLEEEGLAPRLVAAVKAGDELLGSIWVAESDAPLTGPAERELARAAKVAAVHLLSHRASEGIKRRTRGAFVREVLEGWAPSRAAAELPRVEGPFAALVFTYDSDAAPSSASRILNLVSLQCESFHPEAVCAVIDNRVWAVVPARTANGPEPMVALATRILDLAEASLHIRLRAAVGTAVPSLADVPRSRRTAEQALDVLLRRGGASRVVHIQDVQAQAVLQELLDWASENEDLARGKLTVLRELDQTRRTEYCRTLRAYLDARGDVRAAAAHLSIHANTLRYRLSRVVEIAGLDLADPDERLVTELQLRMKP